EKVCIAPSVLQNENGGLDLILLNPISRFELLKFFLQAEKGSHVNSPHVNYITIKQMELKVNKNYVISFDGEELVSKNTEDRDTITCGISSDKIKFFSPL